TSQSLLTIPNKEYLMKANPKLDGKFSAKFSRIRRSGRIDESDVESLKSVRVSDLSHTEFEELKMIAVRHGDITLIGDNATLHSLYNAAMESKKAKSIARKACSEKLENFVMCAAANRQLYYRQHQQREERRETFAGKHDEPDALGKKRRRQFPLGETTIIRK
ncbi:MAG: hypothetical protein WCT31_03280, partial [Candidatus Micrarchaeia archaeon]